MDRVIITNRNVKIVKPKDFDNAAFKRREFDVAMCSWQSVISTLRFLSEKGYVWGGSETSLLKDNNMKKQLFERAGMEPIYITFDDRMPNGVLLTSPYLLYTYGVVEIDFEEDNNMNMNETKKVKAKDFDWEAFRRDRVAIAVDNRYMSNLNKVMKLLNDAGYYWAGNMPLSAKHAQGYKAITDGSHGYITYLSTNGRENDRRVYWSTGYNGCERPVKIVFNKETNNDKIVITNDGKITTATLYSSGKKAGIGTAVCHEGDKFDIYAGAKLALERLEKNKKEADMTDWEKFVNGKVDMRVPKKYLQNFLERAKKDSLEFTGPMENWYLKWLKEDRDSILVGILTGNVSGRVLTQVIRHDNGTEVLYFPGMK